MVTRKESVRKPRARSHKHLTGKPLPPPWFVKNAPLYFKFARMSPDEIRAFVRAEAETGRMEYGDLYDAAALALGPDSPEARECEYEPPLHIACLKEHRDRRAQSFLRHDRSRGYYIESHAIVRNAAGSFEMTTVRCPEEGHLATCPTLAEFLAQHERASETFDAAKGAASMTEADVDGHPAPSLRRRTGKPTRPGAERA